LIVRKSYEYGKRFNTIDCGVGAIFFVIALIGNRLKWKEGGIEGKIQPITRFLFLIFGVPMFALALLGSDNIWVWLTKDPKPSAVELSPKLEKVQNDITAKELQLAKLDDEIKKAIALKEQRLLELDEEIKKAITAKNQKLSELEEKVKKAIAVEKKRFDAAQDAISAKELELVKLKKESKEAITAKDRQLQEIKKYLLAEKQVLDELKRQQEEIKKDIAAKN